jgi:hypothetical protein
MILVSISVASHNGAMPRTARATPGGYCCHVFNRCNRRAEVYHAAEDYAAVVALLRHAWVPATRASRWA